MAAATAAEEDDMTIVDGSGAGYGNGNGDGAGAGHGDCYSDGYGYTHGRSEERRDGKEGSARWGPDH